MARRLDTTNYSCSSAKQGGNTTRHLLSWDTNASLIQTLEHKMADKDYQWLTTDQLEAVDAEDLLPKFPTTDEEKISALLDVLAEPSSFTGDEDMDLVRDSALCGLLQFPKLPERTVEIVLSILADEGDSDLVLTRKMAACDVLGHIGQQAESSLPALYDLLPLSESKHDFKRWLALRAAKAIWNITGDSEPALEVAARLTEDAQFWLVIHAHELLGEIDAAA